MKILIIDWWTYTHDDVIATFSEFGIEYDIIRYLFSDKNHDEVFEKRFGETVNSYCYDFVYSTNYFPVIAECCHRKNLLYISWSYDNPLNVTNIEDTLGLSTNRVFLFDKIQVQNFVDAGFDNVFHLPLGVNTKRLDQVSLSPSDHQLYDADIAFVGKLYPALLQEYQVGMTEYQKGFLQSICDIQQQLHGYYIVDELLDDKLINEINASYRQKRGDDNVVFSKEALSYGISCQATRNERLILLGLLSAHYKLNLYCEEKCDILANANYRGKVDYSSQMPKAFKGGKVNLNINLKISQSGIPLRVMDVLGCGGFLISSFQPEVGEYFIDGEELVLYESIEDAYEKVGWYLRNDDIRLQIAANGRKKVEELFSYKKQMGTMLKLSGVIAE